MTVGSVLLLHDSTVNFHIQFSCKTKKIIENYQQILGTIVRKLIRMVAILKPGLS